MNAIKDFADFNGDGKDDLIWIVASEFGAQQQGYVALSNGAGFDAATVWGTNFLPTDTIADVNGDGRADVVQLFANGNAYVWLSNGHGFDPYTIWANEVRPTDQVADVDGDGRADIVQLRENGSGYVRLSNGHGFGPATVWAVGVTDGADSGHDTFVFSGDFGHDTVTDFQAGQGDLLQFDHTQFADAAAVLARTADDGLGNAVITFDADHTVTLLNVVKADLSAADFRFS